MSIKIHLQTEIKLDIFENPSDIAPKLISETIKKVWPETYLTDLDYEDYIVIIVDMWLNYYIQSDKTKETIIKIKDANPPKDLKVYLVFNLFDDRDNLIIDYSEMSTEPFFRAYLPTNDLWDTYIYSCQEKICKFESLEIIEPAYIDEIKQGMTEREKRNLDNIILQSYSFHNRLLGISTSPRKILLYTAQQPGIIDQWNKSGFIPIGMYFTDKMSRAEYYFSEGDVIVEYRIPEDKVVMTSQFGGANEYVTIENVHIK